MRRPVVLSRWANLNMPTELQRTLAAGAQAAVHTITGLNQHGGRNTDDVASLLLAPLLTVVPLQLWSRALAIARADDSAPADLNVANHIIVLDRDAAADAALARAAQQSRDDVHDPSAALETLVAAAASVGERQRQADRRSRPTPATDGPNARRRQALRDKTEETFADAALSVVRHLSRAPAGATLPRAGTNHPCPDRLPVHDRARAAALTWLVDNVEHGLQAELEVVAETGVHGNDIVHRRLASASKELDKMLAGMVKIGNISAGMLSGPMSAAFDEWLAAVGVAAEDAMHPLLKLKTAKEFAVVAKSTVPEAVGRVTTVPDTLEELAACGASVGDEPVAALQAMLTWPGAAQHVEQALQVALDKGMKGLTAVFWHDGFKGQLLSKTTKKGKMYTQGGVSLMTLGMRATETWIAPTFFMSENDKPGPTRMHLRHLTQGLPERLVKDGVVNLSVDLPGRDSPLVVPIVRAMWCHDMAGLNNIMLRQDPRWALPHSGVEGVTRLVRQFASNSGFLLRATPDLTAARTCWDLSDTTNTAASLKGMGYDTADVAYLRSAESPARTWNVENTSVDLLHGTTALRTNTCPLLCSQQLAMGPKHLQRFDQQLRKAGVYMNPVPTTYSLQTSPKHGQLVDAYLDTDLTQLMWVDGLPDDVNVNNARLNWVQGIVLQLNHMAHTEDLQALNVVCVLSWTLQQMLGHWGCTGEGTDVDARITPSATHNRDAVHLRNRLCQDEGLAPLCFGGRQQEDAHVPAARELRHGAGRGGGDARVAAPERQAAVCTDTLDALRLLRTCVK